MIWHPHLASAGIVDMWHTYIQGGKPLKHIKINIKNPMAIKCFSSAVLQHKWNSRHNTQHTLCCADLEPGLPEAFFPFPFVSSRFFFLFWKWFSHLTFLPQSNSSLFFLLLCVSECVHACMFACRHVCMYKSKLDIRSLPWLLSILFLETESFS